MPQNKNGKRQAILEAALELIAERGFHDAPTSLIARQAEVGVGTIYRYFRDKDELIRELYRELHGRAHARIFADYPQERPVPERFLFVFTQLLRFFLDSPREFKFLELYYFSPFSTTGEDGPAEEEDTIARLLEEARAHGVIMDAPLPVLKSLAYGPLVALAKENINRNMEVDEGMIGQTVAACWKGLQL